MEKYRQERQRTENIAKTSGMVLTIAAHVVLAVFGVFTGLKYIYPPPPENTFLVDFSEVEDERPVPAKTGNQPHAEVVDKTKNIELVQKSEAQNKGTKANKAPEARVDEFGDVEVKEPKREKVIDKRSLFHTADNKAEKDTLAAQTASKVSDALKAGHASGNTSKGKLDGEPNAHLKGRNTVGTLAKPSYGVQEEGIVVVTIWVDQYGKVKKAIAGAEGTTVSNSKLWQAARDAAMNTHFNQSADAPALQQGTITYKFKLN